MERRSSDRRNRCSVTELAPIPIADHDVRDLAQPIVVSDLEPSIRSVDKVLVRLSPLGAGAATIGKVLSRTRSEPASEEPWDSSATSIT